MPLPSKEEPSEKENTYGFFKPPKQSRIEFMTKKKSKQLG